MQHLASVFPQMAFPHQQQQSQSQQNQPERSDGGQLSPELQQLLFSIDQNAYMNQLATMKTPIQTTQQSAPVGTAATPPNDLANLIFSLAGQSVMPEVKQEPEPTTPNAVTSGNDELSKIMALLSGSQASSSNFMDSLFASSMPGQCTPTSMNGLSTSNPSSMTMPSAFAGLQQNNKDSYCELCNKTFCNRYFLRTHKLKKHGIDMSQQPGQQSQTQQSPLKLTGKPDFVPSPTLSQPEKEDDKTSVDAMVLALQESLQSNSNNNILSLIKQLADKSSKSPEPMCERFACDQCDKEFPSQALLGQHQLVAHVVNMNPSPISTSTAPTAPAVSGANSSNILNMLPQGFPQLPFMLPGLNSSFPALDMENNAFSNLPMTSLTPNSAKSTSKKQYSSTTKNYCDMCNKEVCNKYFLRTHMLKMHNIVIDENKTVIANIDTQEKEREGSVHFRCDVCHLDMTTRNQLREHKQVVHGIQPLVAPSSAGSQTSRTNSSKPTSATNSAIGSGVPNGAATAFQFPPVASSSSSSSAAESPADCKCPRCGLEFPMTSSLVDHMQTEHGMTSKDLMELLSKASTSSSPFGVKLEEDADEAMEVTREVAFKMAAENLKAKDSLVLKSPRPHSCFQCSRSYTSKERLEDHVATVHQYKVRLSPKKAANKLVLSPAKINKMIKSFSCAKCHQRFATNMECKMHVIGHLRALPKDGDEDVEMKDEMEEEHKENKDFDDALIDSYITEEVLPSEKRGLEQVVCDLSRRGSHSGLAKLPEEKHSHTSGSASPMSVQTMPEVFAQQYSSEEPKEFSMQSFIMREVNADGTASSVSTPSPLPAELQAFLPIRGAVDGPLRVTFELIPVTQQSDGHSKGL